MNDEEPEIGQWEAIEPSFEYQMALPRRTIPTLVIRFRDNDFDSRDKLLKVLTANCRHIHACRPISGFLTCMRCGFIVNPITPDEAAP